MQFIARDRLVIQYPLFATMLRFCRVARTRMGRPPLTWLAKDRICTLCVCVPSVRSVCGPLHPVGGLLGAPCHREGRCVCASTANLVSISWYQGTSTRESGSHNWFGMSHRHGGKWIQKNVDGFDWQRIGKSCSVAWPLFCRSADTCSDSLV